MTEGRTQCDCCNYVTKVEPIRTYVGNEVEIRHYCDLCSSTVTSAKNRSGHPLSLIHI